MKTWIIFAAMFLLSFSITAQEARVELDASKIINESNIGNATALVDEQRAIIGPPAGKPAKGWKIGGQHKNKFPVSIYLDLGAKKNLSKLWLFDTNGKGDVVISVGEPGNWQEITTYGCGKYLSWVPIPLDVNSRYIRLTRKTGGSNFSEVAVYEYTPEAWEEVQKKKAEAIAREKARQKALAQAMKEMKKRPLVDLGKPFGKCYLVDQIDCTKTNTHEFMEYPKGNSKVETILGRKCRVIPPVKGEGSYIAYRIGKIKMLQGGQPLVLVIDYPEDNPRTFVVINNGCETRRGFHTGMTLGDAFEPKYVNNLNESINTPLSNKWEQYQLFFQLHDKLTSTPELPRGANFARSTTPEDGFWVSVSQYSKNNIPKSKGVAVSKISLYAIPDKKALNLKINYPAKGLPRRRIFWREEMADGVLGNYKKMPPKNPGLINFLDWYKYKAELMQLLGMNTYTKDLLEFGACQGWDSTPYGGHKWVYFGPNIKHFWQEIVGLMGDYGFEVFPYYEYSGSKGQKGLGFQRRCRPLKNRPGNYYTHIKWVEKATADITDPDTYEDFKKMLDLTVINLKNKAKFTGIWLRPRGQLPISFADATIKRFNKDTGKDANRTKLQKDKALYNEYIQWWNKKRQDFLAAMRDYLRQNGVNDAIVMLTGTPSEPGVGFPTWNPTFVTDKPEAWKTVFDAKFADKPLRPGRKLEMLTPQDVVKNNRYLKALKSPGKNWGGHEISHARPGDDPNNYRKAEGLLLAHAFNRLYTVSDPASFDAYRTPAGLAITRHYSLNENMMFNKEDKNLLGYFVADMEKAGPYCMMAEAVAMANGDPTMIGYLSGGNFGRGFPKYVRNFNQAFLSLPAMPSKRLKGVSSDPEVVVREIKTPKNGTYYSIVSTGMKEKKNVTISLPAKGKVIDAAIGKPMKANNGKVKLSFYPYQLHSILVK